MDKKTLTKYLTWVLAVVAVVFLLAGWYYTGGFDKIEGFFSPKSSEKMTDVAANAGSCSVGTCG